MRPKLKLKFLFDDENYKITIHNLNNKKNTICELNIKRAYLALKFILKSFPKYLNSHNRSFERAYGDTNRAISALQKEEGYANFLNERRADNKNKEYLFKMEKFLQIWEGKKVQLITNIRVGPSSNVKKQLKVNQKNRCNISNFLLTEKVEKRSFMSSALKLVYDHRIPLSEQGDSNPNEIDNWQIISEYVNNEKLKLCVSCIKKICSKCALAFPETEETIISNDQNISNIF